MPSDGSSPLEHLVAEFLELRESDRSSTVEAFVAAHPEFGPELGDAIRSALRVQEQLGLAGLVVPDHIGPYRIGGLLGKGGMGLVFEAEHEGRSYALKLLLLGAGASPAALDRFRREARSLARLAHPGIVGVHDAGVFQGAPYLVMQRVDGPSLDRAGLPMTVERAVRIVRDLALAVAAAHEAGILHRDLKPSNVILTAEDRPVLVDFGLVLAEDESTLTASGAILGTPRYMAPEQADGAPAEARTDVYALGLILFELVHGTPARPAGSRAEVLAQVRRASLHSIRSTRLPRPLERLLRGTLAREPRRRPPTARALAEDLERFLAHEPVRHRPPRLDQRCSDAARRHPWRAAVALALASLLVLLGTRLRQSSEAERATRARVDGHVDAALCAWMQGIEATARHELDQARALDPNDGDVSAVQSVLGGQVPPRGARSWITNGLVPLVAGDPRSAEPALAPLVRSLAPAAALHVRALDGLGDHDGALEASWTGVERFPGSSALWAEGIRLLEAAGRPAEARQRLATAPASVSGQVPLLAASVRLALATKAWDEAVEAALSAAGGLRAAGTDPAAEIPRWLVLAKPNGETRAALERRVARADPSPLLQFALAYALDSDHRLPEAEAAYARALELDGTFLRARLNLAHLRAGAQRSACQACDRAYSASPAVYAPARALEDLRLALAQDRGEGELCLSRAVQTALSLEARDPGVGAVAFIAARLDDLLGQDDLTPGARSRISEGLSRLTLAGGR